MCFDCGAATTWAVTGEGCRDETSDEMMTRMWMAVGTLNGAACMLTRMRMVFDSDADAVDSEAGWLTRMLKRLTRMRIACDSDTDDE
jgi:hypothetical protein